VIVLSGARLEDKIVITLGASSGAAVKKSTRDKKLYSSLLLTEKNTVAIQTE